MCSRVWACPDAVHSAGGLEEPPWVWGLETNLYPQDNVWRQGKPLFLSPKHSWSFCHHLRTKLHAYQGLVLGHRHQLQLPAPQAQKVNPEQKGYSFHPSNPQAKRRSTEMNPMNVCTTLYKASSPPSAWYSFSQCFAFVAPLSTLTGYL